MNITIFASFYKPHIGGFEKNVHELAKRLVARGNSVSVITCNTNNAQTYEVIDEVFVVRLPCWNILDGAYPIPKLSSELFSTRLLVNPDIVVTQTRFFITSFLGMLYSVVRKRPLIHVERGSCHSVVSNKIVDIICRVYDHTLGSLLVKIAKTNIGISKPACDFIEHIGGKNIQLIYNGVETNVAKYQAPYKPKIINIIYVGRLIYAKGVQDLIEAFDIYCGGFGRYKLTIVGDGNYRKQLEEYAKKSAYCGQIKFVGEVSQRKVMELLSKSDIFVNPSYSEGLPTSVLEAASLGLPIIATNVGGTSEIIEDGVSGLLYEPHDIYSLWKKLEMLIISKDFAINLGNNAKKEVSTKFSWDKVVRQYGTLLNEVTRYD